MVEDMARKACGLDQGDSTKQALLIHINEIANGPEEHPIEASVIDVELLSDAAVSVLQEEVSPNES